MGYCGRKSLAPSGTGRQSSRGGDEKDDDLGGDERGLYPPLPLQEDRQDREIAAQLHCGDQSDAAQAQIVTIGQEPQPPPAHRRTGPRDVLAHGQLPERRQRLEGQERWQDAAGVQNERNERGGERREGESAEPARIELLDDLLSAHGHRPVPRPTARAPARSSTAITTRRTMNAGVRASTLAPSREPSMTPRIAGTASAGSRAPRWI